MKEKITVKLLNSLKPQEKSYRVHDTLQPGLLIRVQPSGHASYMVTWERNKATTLGRVGKMTLEQARTEAAQHLADAHAYGEPLAVTQSRQSIAAPTLRSFLDDFYYKWFKTHNKSYAKTRHAIEYSFKEIMDHNLDNITLRDVESLRIRWLEAGLTESSANRKIATLRGVFARAIDWDQLTTHPLTNLKQLKIDGRARVRYLSDAEEVSLLAALNSREERIRAERDSANAWRKDRGKNLLPDLRNSSYADYLLPMYLVSLNTGIRRGELFNLSWDDVDFIRKTLTIEGASSKSGQTLHTPLNQKAFQALELWRQATHGNDYIFPSKNGGRLDNIRKSWEGVLKAAGIKAFRWHDLRHTFASKLVMRGVPINTVRDLLGHKDPKTTLRYAHLAPDDRAKAVELL